jgi:hypothetical protein
MVFPEKLDEIWIREDASPMLADQGDARKGGWLRREAEEDLLQKVLIIQRGRRPRC